MNEESIVVVNFIFDNFIKQNISAETESEEVERLTKYAIWDIYLENTSVVNVIENILYEEVLLKDGVLIDSYDGVGDVISENQLLKDINTYINSNIAPSYMSTEMLSELLKSIIKCKMFIKASWICENYQVLNNCDYGFSGLFSETISLTNESGDVETYKECSIRPKEFFDKYPVVKEEETDDGEIEMTVKDFAGNEETFTDIGILTILDSSVYRRDSDDIIKTIIAVEGEEAIENILYYGDINETPFFVLCDKRFIISEGIHTYKEIDDSDLPY